MNESWEIKKQLTSKITNPKIEDIYNLAMSCGADGAKVCGAGGGGFLLVCVKEENKEHLRSTMKEYKELKFGFDYEGTSIV